MHVWECNVLCSLPKHAHRSHLILVNWLVLFEQGGWIGWPPEVPSNLSSSVLIPKSHTSFSPIVPWIKRILIQCLISVSSSISLGLYHSVFACWWCCLLAPWLLLNVWQMQYRMKYCKAHSDYQLKCFRLCYLCFLSVLVHLQNAIICNWPAYC